jgi:hypothetical protein
MSSDRKGSVGDATTAREPASAVVTDAAGTTADNGLSQGISDDGQPDDPWFTPGPKPAAINEAESVEASPVEAESVEASTVEASPVEASTGEGISGQAQQAEWFLRTGRAGLHPDVMTSFDDASMEPSAGHHEVRVTAAGAPPWAGETADASASAPPPWETGPWPGPGHPGSPGWSATGDGDHETSRRASTSAATTSLTGSGPLLGAAPDGAALDEAVLDDGGALDAATRWSARTVAATGVIPLVVPGLVVGFLSLRQVGGEAVRRAAWLAIGASLAWAVIIVLIVASAVGGSPGGCTGYPAAVHQAYGKVLTDMRGNAPASVQAADLETAASLANSSAAATGQIGVRTMLFTMAGDMAQARADVVARRPIPATLRQHLAADGTLPSGSCTG